MFLFAASVWPAGANTELPSFLSAIILFEGMTLTYIILYSAIEEDSPTLAVLNALLAQTEHGSAHNALVKQLAQGRLFRRRVQMMIESGLIRKNPDGTLGIATQRHPLFAILWFRKHILSLRKGG
jgi:hypothetical protein